MPRVPTLDSQVQDRETRLGGGQVAPPQTNRQAEQSSRQQFGQATKGIVDLAVQIQKQEIKKANDLAVTDAKIGLMKIEDEYLYGRDGQGGYLNTRGKDSIDGIGSVMEDWDKGVQDIAGTLANESQRIAFNNYALQSKVSFSRAGQRHFNAEKDRYEERQTFALNKLYQDRAIRNPYNKEVVDDAFKQVTMNADKLIRERSMSPEASKVLKEDMHGMFAVSMIKAGLDGGNIDEAEKIMERFKKYIPAKDAKPFEERIKLELLKRKARVNVQSLEDETGGDQAKMYDKIRSIKDDEIRGQTFKEFDIYKKQVEDAKNGRMDRDFSEASERAMAYLQAHGSVPRLEDAVGGLYDQLDKNTKSALKKIVDEKTKTNPRKKNLFNALKDDELRLIKSEREFYEKYGAHLNSDDRAVAYKKWDEAVKGIGKKIRGSKRLREVVVERLLNSGYINGDEKDSDKERIGAVKGHVEDAVELMQEQGVRMDLNDMWQKSIDDLLKQKIAVDKSWFWFKDPELPPATLTKQEMRLIKVPEDHRVYIINLIKRAGFPDTEENIKRVYHQKVIGRAIPIARLLAPEE